MLPSAEITPAADPSSENELPVTLPEKSSFPLIPVVLIMGLAFLAVGFTFAWRNMLERPSTSSSDQVQTEPNFFQELADLATETDEEVAESLIDPQNRLLFTTNPDRDQATNVQAHLIHPDGSNQTALDLPNLNTAFKHPQSQLIFFTKQNDGAAFYIKNLANDLITTFTIPLVHPDPEAKISLGLYNLNSIAPDGSAVVLQIDFFKTCPPLDLPEGAMGGSGPCQPEPLDDFKAGNYLYNLKTNSMTFLGQAIVPSRWHISGRQFYFNSLDTPENGLLKIDLNTNAVTVVEKSNTFGYGGFPFFVTNRRVQINAETGNTANTPSYSQISLIDETGAVNTFDRGAWADIQPFAQISPEEEFVIYLRSPLTNGLSINQLHLYNVATGERSQLSPKTPDQSFSINGVWIDSDTFITSVDPIELEGTFYNGNNYLVRFDLDTGEMTRITEGTEVYRFATN